MKCKLSLITLIFSISFSYFANVKFYVNDLLGLHNHPIGTSTLDSKFSWKMTGLDKEWNQPSNHNRLAYANIPTDSYTLKLKMYDSPLSQDITERQFKVRVTPPFWESGWFRFIIFAFVAGIISFSFRFYINRLKQRNTEEKIRFFTNMDISDLQRFAT